MSRLDGGALDVVTVEVQRLARHPAPVAVPIASYIGQHLRLLAICDDCWNVATLGPAAMID